MWSGPVVLRFVGVTRGRDSCNELPLGGTPGGRGLGCPVG